MVYALSSDIKGIAEQQDNHNTYEEVHFYTQIISRLLAIYPLSLVIVLIVFNVEFRLGGIIAVLQ